MIENCCSIKPKISTDSTSTFEISSTESIEEAVDEDNIEPPISAEIEQSLPIRRWFVLASYCMLTLVCGSTWLCFPAVSNIMQTYYNIDVIAVNMLSIVFCISIVVFSVPFAMLLDRFGLAAVMKISAFLNLTGSIIKYFGENQEYGYWLLLSGNIFHSLSIASFLFLPGNIASLWFGANEIGKAVSVCTAFDALGTGFGFLLATTIIQNHEDQQIVQKGIKTFVTCQMVLSIAVFILVCVFAKKRPQAPPVLSELDFQVKHELLAVQNFHDSITSQTCSIESPHNRSMSSSLLKLLKNKDFQFIFHIQGIVASVEGLLELLLNEILIGLFSGMEKSIGLLGFVSVILGFVTNIMMGTVLDKTGYYRRITFGVFAVSTLLSVSWMVAIEKIHNFIVIAIILALLMSTITSYYTIAFAHSMLVTPSVPPEATGVMLVLTSQIYDAITSFAGTTLLEICGIRTVNCFITFLCFIASVLSFFLKDKRPSSFV